MKSTIYCECVGLLAQPKMQTSGIRLKIIRLWDVFDGVDVFVCGLYFFVRVPERLCVCVFAFPRPRKPCAVYRHNYANQGHQVCHTEPTHRLTQRQRKGGSIYSLPDVFSYHSLTECRWWLSHKEWDCETGVAFRHICVPLCLLEI